MHEETGQAPLRLVRSADSPPEDFALGSAGDTSLPKEPATPPNLAGESTISIRLLWPFLRVTGADPAALPALAAEGISPRSFANPDTRIRFSVVAGMLERAVEKTGDSRLGLRAGEAFESGDLDVLEYAARTCATLREAIHTSCRYFHLLNSAAEMMLIEQDDRAMWRFRSLQERPVSPPALNDFVVTCARMFAQRYVTQAEPVLEVHFAHAEPTDMEAYRRLFGGTIRMGMAHNALVFRRAHLDSPMVHANAGMQAAFASHADQMLHRISPAPGIAGRVRQLLLSRVRSGDTSMGSVARALAMSIATLRRRLQEEGTSHSQLLDEVRHDLARMYLAEPSLAISEVAFLLGFAHVTAFYKAFRRWEGGATPAEFRSGRMSQRASGT